MEKKSSSMFHFLSKNSFSYGHNPTWKLYHLRFSWLWTSRTIRSWCLRSQIFHLIFVNFLQSWYSAFIYNLQIVRTFWQTRAFKKHIFQLISGTLWILKPNLKRWFLLKGLGLYIKTWYAIVEYSFFFFYLNI